MTTPLDRLEANYPSVAVHCHDFVDAVRMYLLGGAEQIARRSSSLTVEAVRAAPSLPGYYAKLHTVTYLPTIFLKLCGAVWSATDDVRRGLWALDVVESALGVGMDSVAVAAVNAGVAAGDDEPDAALYVEIVAEGVRLVAAAVFDATLALIEK